MAQITLKDIAFALGVSPTTVHRALYNKDGISQQMRAKVLKKAESLGYQTNYIASSLKRHPIKIALVLPSGEGPGRYYFQFLWESLLECFEDARSFHVEVIQRTYHDSAEEHCRVLSELLEEKGEILNGLITLPFSADEKTTHILNAYGHAGISVVLFDTDVPGAPRLSCVAPHEYDNGALAAEVLTLLTPDHGKVLIAGGAEDNRSHIRTIHGFTDYLQAHVSHLEPVIIYSYHDVKQSYQLTLDALHAHPDIVGFYSVTARELEPVCQAVIAAGKAGTLRGIGNDLFRESANYLEQDVLQCVISKNNYEKGVLGFNILFDYLVRNIDPKEDVVQVPTQLVIKGNLQFFKENL